jgi:hypothetical protein
VSSAFFVQLPAFNCFPLVAPPGLFSLLALALCTLLALALLTLALDFLALLHLQLFLLTAFLLFHFSALFFSTATTLSFCTHGCGHTLVLG